MNQIKWSPEFAVGIARIDRQHQGLFTLTNELQESLDKGWNQDKIRELFDLLIENAILHFGDEEAYMSVYRYPSQDSHVLQHKDLIQQAEFLESQWNKGKLVFTPEVATFFQNWLTTHVMGPDRELADFLRTCGIA